MLKKSSINRAGSGGVYLTSVLLPEAYLEAQPLRLVQVAEQVGPTLRERLVVWSAVRQLHNREATVRVPARGHFSYKALHNSQIPHILLIV